MPDGVFAGRRPLRATGPDASQPGIHGPGDPAAHRERAESTTRRIQLSNWITGTFKFVAPEIPIHFPITPSIDVENLLLESWRRLDEGERPRREKLHVDSEICLTCTIACNEEIKARFLKSDICLWRNMPTITKDHAFLAARRKSAQDEESEWYDDLPFL